MRRALHLLLLKVYQRLPVLLRRRVVRTLSPSYTVGAMCILERADGALLLVRHSYRHRWGVPGGLLEKGEEPIDALRREVREETALDVDVVGEPAVVVDSRGQRIDIVFRAHLASADVAVPVPSSPEIVDARWFRADALPELQFETANALVALARSARSPQARAMSAPEPRAVRRSDAV